MRDRGRRAAGAAFVVACGLWGGGSCNFAPRYERPTSPVPGRFDGAGEASGLAAADRGWRDVFRSARLQTLLEAALRDNRDLRVAVLNVAIARATYQIEGAALYPTVSATASGQIVGTVDGLQTSPGAAGFPSYRVGVGIPAYEVDLFGRVRNLKASALESYLSTVEATRAAHIALVSAVARQYLRERGFEEQRAIAAQTVTLVTDLAAATRRLFEAGQRSELDVKTAEAQLHAVRAEVIRLTRARDQAANALSVLVGRALSPDLPLAEPLSSDVITADLPIGLPSDVLLRRPDVLAAEHALRAAHADIGVARAAFFPTISLTAFAGVASTSLRGLVSAPFAWSVGPQLSVPLFTAGRNRSTLEVAKLRRLVEVARYERSIQVAFREVSDALVARTSLDEQLAAHTERVAAERRRLELSQTRYRTGIESYLGVLAAQQDLYQTEQQLIELRLQRLTNLVDLYAALGGGWK